MGNFLRRLFAIMLLSGSVAMPVIVWQATWSILSEDFLHNYRKKTRNRDATLPDELKNLALTDIELILRSYGSSLAKFEKMPFPIGKALSRKTNYLIVDEKSYDLTKMREKLNDDLLTITYEQRSIYDEILEAIYSNRGGVFFVYCFGGSGKTYRWSVLGATLRTQGNIVLNMASSGIAALLLVGGRTADSRFPIPLIVNESTTCAISADSNLAGLLRETDLIVWDEAPMMNKYCFESLDRSMRDILKSRKPFGGKVIVFGGDFRQVLPIITNGGRSETVMASLNSSRNWRGCKVRKLTKNMRVQQKSDGVVDTEILASKQWILDVGDGLINEPNTGEVEIEIPTDLLIQFSSNPIQAIVTEIYSSNYANETDPKFFQSKAILGPRHKDVDNVNCFMIIFLYLRSSLCRV